MPLSADSLRNLLAEMGSTTRPTLPIPPRPPGVPTPPHSALAGVDDPTISIMTTPWWPIADPHDPTPIYDQLVTTMPDPRFLPEPATVPASDTSPTSDTPDES